jgi:hypothetical protein
VDVTSLVVVTVAGRLADMGVSPASLAGRFVVFGGGKLEYRKAQDVVVQVCCSVFAVTVAWSHC